MILFCLLLFGSSASQYSLLSCCCSAAAAAGRPTQPQRLYVSPPPCATGGTSLSFPLAACRSGERDPPPLGGSSHHAVPAALGERGGAPLAPLSVGSGGGILSPSGAAGGVPSHQALPAALGERTPLAGGGPSHRSGQRPLKLEATQHAQQKQHVYIILAKSIPFKTF